jgi:hypothetical protein
MAAIQPALINLTRGLEDAAEREFSPASGDGAPYGVDKYFDYAHGCFALCLSFAASQSESVTSDLAPRSSGW